MAAAKIIIFMLATSGTYQCSPVLSTLHAYYNITFGLQWPCHCCPHFNLFIKFCIVCFRNFAQVSAILFVVIGYSIIIGWHCNCCNSSRFPLFRNRSAADLNSVINFQFPQWVLRCCNLWLPPSQSPPKASHTTNATVVPSVGATHLHNNILCKRSRVFHSYV